MRERALAQHGGLCLAFLDRDLRYVHVTDSFARLQGRAAADYTGRTLDEMPLPTASAGAYVEHVLRTGKATEDVTLRDERSPHVRIWSAAFHPLRNERDAVTVISCAFREIRRSTTADSEFALRKQLAFEQFVVDLSARFVNVPSERVDAEIQDGLRRLVEYLGVDRSTLARLTPTDGMVILGSYAVTGSTSPAPMGQFGVELKWYISELMQGRVVRLCNMDELPPDAVAEREYARSIGMKSHVAIPVSVGGMPHCMLGMGSFRKEYEFPEEAIPRLRLVGEVFANALARRDADVRYRRMQAELSHVTRVSTIGQLAASIAHEINQPLCAIINYAHAAMRQLGQPHTDLGEIASALKDIASDGKRAGDVVMRSHGLMKRREIAFEPLSINNVVRDVVSLVHSEAVIRHVGLRLELGESLPKVFGDRVQLQQVVLNLIVNAIDAAADAPEGPRLVTLRSTQEGAAVCVAVLDTGVGLTPDVASRMFDPFFTTKQNGLGMGLTINRSIIEAHGGTLAAAENRARGACLTFCLPSAATR